MSWEVTQVSLDAATEPRAPATREERRTSARYDDVLVALRRIMRATDLYSKQLSKTAGLTSPQLLILQAISDAGDVTIGTIARHVSLSQATVTTILDRLERRGLVYRQRSTVDKRKVHAHLTDAGRAALDDAPTPLQQSFTDRFRDLQDWEKSMITASLQRVADMMDAGTIDASPVLHVGMIDRHYDGNDSTTEKARARPVRSANEPEADGSAAS